MNWLITGGAGFVGTNLIARLLSEDMPPNITIYDNFSASSMDELAAAMPHDVQPVLIQPGDWDHPLAVIQGDIRDAALLAEAADQANVIIHLAANTGVGPSVDDPRADCEANVIGVLNMLEAARASGQKPQIVFASSGAPAGICEPPITETIAPRPASPYGASKLAGEAYCSAYAVSFDLPTVALRFSNVYGPRSFRKGSVVATFIRQTLAREPITINGDGSQTRDFVYVDDLTDAIFRAATRPGLKGELFQISTGQETSVNELLTNLNEVLRDHDITPSEVEFGTRSAADVLRNYADSSKAKAGLGWTPQTPLKTGLKKTVKWFLDR